MREYGKDTGIPETHRITLAISVALLIHTLFMASFPFSQPEHNHNPVTVRVQLMPEGSVASKQNALSPGTSEAPESPVVRATPFTIESTQASRPPGRIPTTSSPQPRAAPEPFRKQDSLPDNRNSPKPINKPRPEPEKQDMPASGTAASAPSPAGEKPAPQDDTEQPLTLRSETPSEKSSYLSLLVQTIARKAKIPKLEDFDQGQVLSVELELSLMSNGALVGARIAESSGHDGLDQRVYRAALAASPYPEPPSSGNRKQRFRVEVKYTF